MRYNGRTDVICRLVDKSVDDSGHWPSYRLGFPNYEVADGFNTWLARAYVGDAAEQTSVHLLGLSCDCSVHNVVAWECEEL